MLVQKVPPQWSDFRCSVRVHHPLMAGSCPRRLSPSDVQLGEPKTYSPAGRKSVFRKFYQIGTRKR
jgi:hypothetical protein